MHTHAVTAHVMALSGSVSLCNNMPLVLTTALGSPTLSGLDMQSSAQYQPLQEDLTVLAYFRG